MAQSFGKYTGPILLVVMNSCILAAVEQAALSNKSVVIPGLTDTCAEVVKTLFKPANTLVPPLQRTEVNFSMRIYSLNNVEPTVGEVWITVVPEIMWRDPRLAYNHTACQLSPIKTKDVSDIWFPNFIIPNMVTEGADQYSMLSKFPAAIDKWGGVTWRVPISLAISCHMRVKWFPWDTQFCVIQIKSPLYFNSYFADKMKLANPDDQQFTVDFIPTGFELVDRTAVSHPMWAINGVCFEFFKTSPLSNAYFHFRMTRKPTYHIVVLILPTVVLSCLMACIFIVSAKERDKLMAALTAVLSWFILLFTLAGQVPASSELSTLAVFYVYLLFLSTVVTIWGAIIRRLEQSSQEKHQLAEKFNNFGFIAYCVLTVFGYVVYGVIVSTLRDAELDEDNKNAACKFQMYNFSTDVVSARYNVNVTK